MQYNRGGLIQTTKFRKNAIITIKISIGSSISIMLAQMLHLEFASSAGIITLLSVLGTKWATLRLSGVRILSFFMTVILAWTIFMHIGSEWLTYGIFIFLLVGISYFLGWKDTISVNAVIGTHFWTLHDFGMRSVANEFLLIFIGVFVAIILNLFHGNRYQRGQIIKDIRYIEGELQKILQTLAAYLMQEEIQGDVWEDITGLENHLAHSVERAYDYQGNTFVSHPEYYIHYMEMRVDQCHVLHNLHNQINKIRTMPEQAEQIAVYIRDMSEHVTEMNIPREQIEKLHLVSDRFHADELPKTRDEFEARAILYHIMMDLEEFLIFKRRFIDELSEEKKKIYWKEEI